METLERIRVPSAAEQVHAAGLAVVSGWLGVLQTARSGAPVRQAVREVDALTERANQELERYRSANFPPSAPSE